MNKLYTIIAASAILMVPGYAMADECIDPDMVDLSKYEIVGPCDSNLSTDFGMAGGGMYAMNPRVPPRKPPVRVRPKQPAPSPMPVPIKKDPRVASFCQLTSDDLTFDDMGSNGVMHICTYSCASGTPGNNTMYSYTLVSAMECVGQLSYQQVRDRGGMPY